MRIEQGKYYRTRNGRKVGPMARHEYGWTADDGFRIYDADGKRVLGFGTPEPTDLVAEWADEGPVRTVTRQEIIPGTYDGVKVGERIENFVSVEFHVLLADADQIERAAAVLTALAGALRDGE